MFLTNCNIFIHKRDELTTIICDMKPKIIILTELFTKRLVYDLDAASFHLSNSQLFITDLDKGRGVAIYVHYSIKADRVNCFDDIE